MTAMGWQKAKDAAWREFGRRYWRLLVGVELAKKAAPGLLVGLTVTALAAGVWWLVTHLPAVSAPSSVSLDVPGRWWWWPIGAAAVVAVVVLLARRRDPLAARRRPATVARGVVAALTVAGAVLLLLVWRGA